MPSQKPVSVKFTENFESNLAEIEAFCVLNDFPQGYLHLLDELGETVIPNLERFPAMGRPFMARQLESVEAVTKMEKLHQRLVQLKGNAELREYVLPDYLVLYEATESVVHMLSIQHHKQLSFDFEHFGLGG